MILLLTPCKNWIEDFVNTVKPDHCQFFIMAFTPGPSCTILCRMTIIVSLYYLKLQLEHEIRQALKKNSKQIDTAMIAVK